MCRYVFIFLNSNVQITFSFPLVFQIRCVYLNGFFVGLYLVVFLNFNSSYVY